MTSTVALAPSQKLVTHTAKAFFRLGLLVEDLSGRRYGLTARHILESEADDRVYDAATTKLVGQRVILARHGRSERDFSETIGAFALDSAVSVDVADTLTRGLDVISPDQAIGRPVVKVERAGRRVAARGVGFGGSIAFWQSGRGEVIFRNVLEITFENLRREPVAPGEAGSLVLSQSGAAIGLMIAGTRDACYVAPLLPYLRERSLRPIDSASLGQFESSFEQDALFERDVIDELSPDYRSALTGAEQMRSDLRGEECSVADPYEEPISQRMLDLLGVD